MHIRDIAMLTKEYDNETYTTELKALATKFLKISTNPKYEK